MPEYDFPFWLRASHLINFFLIGLLIRSGGRLSRRIPGSTGATTAARARSGSSSPNG